MHNLIPGMGGGVNSVNAACKEGHKHHALLLQVPLIIYCMMSMALKHWKFISKLLIFIKTSLVLKLTQLTGFMYLSS